MQCPLVDNSISNLSITLGNFLNLLKKTMPTCRKISYRNNISTIMWGHNVVDLDPFRFATITWIQIRSDSQQCCGSGSVQIHNNYSDRDPIRFATITRIRSCTTNCHESVKENLTKLVHKDLLIIKSVLKLKFF